MQGVVGRDAEFEISGALLRRGHDIPSMVASLADRLERALPDHVVTRRAMFRRHLRELVVQLDPTWFRIDVRGHRATTWIDHIVRGVCVRSEDVSVDDWFDRLAAALEAEATRSTEIRLALEEALG